MKRHSIRSILSLVLALSVTGCAVNHGRVEYIGAQSAKSIAAQAAGFDPAKLKEIKDDRSFAAKLDCRTRPLFILPTYSAMMRLRPVLAKKSRSKDFWE